MKLETFSYDPLRGWSRPFPALDGPATLVLVFGGSGLRDRLDPFQELRKAFPLATVLGCSSSGEILGTCVSDDTLSVAVVQFSGTSVSRAEEKIAGAEDSLGAGEGLGKALNRSGLKGIFILSDGLQVNGSELVRGLNGALPEGVVVTGGLAGDGARFQSTWTLDGNGLPQSGFVTAVGFYGDRVRIGHGSRGGWDSFGPERRVTRARGNVLFELDGKPALSLYKGYLGDRASGLPATALLFPLALRTSEGDDRQLVRTVLSVDEADQSMTFAGDIPEGSLAQLMRANFDRLIDGAGEAAERIGQLPEAPTLSIAISCVGRRLVLGERAEEEVEATLEVLPKATQQVGFYSYGELSPWGLGACDLHNQTMTLTTLQEADG